jgi:hypothetical protein
VRGDDTANDCGGTEQLLLSEVPAGATRLCAVATRHGEARAKENQAQSSDGPMETCR